MSIPEASSPRFCPRCRKTRPEAASLCLECGDALAGCGYCGVCDRFWNLHAGELCPKHDIPLDDQPPPSVRERLEGEFSDWASIAAYSNPMEVEGPRIRLEAEGIPTFVEGGRVGAHGIYQVATGGVRLQVPRDLLGEARIVLSQTWSSPIEPDDDLDDAWDDLAPDSGWRRRAVMKGAIVLFLSLPFWTWLLRVLAGR